MSHKKLIVTHHAPDLDAIGAAWVLTRFDAQHYEDAKFEFVNPGTRIDLTQAEQLGYSAEQITHVDTGKGRFDHHQPERASQHVCAASLTYEHVLQLHPELRQDIALKEVIDFINTIDHFGEIDWPESDHNRYTMMLHELLRGFELKFPHSNNSQMLFGLKALDCAYQSMEETTQAKQIIQKEGQEFALDGGMGLGLETANDATLKEAQKKGYVLVIRKDPKLGHVRIKARPDSDLNLTALYDKIIKIDEIGTWFNHPGGKMLLNGSMKNNNQTPTKMSLEKVINLVQEVYA